MKKWFVRSCIVAAVSTATIAPTESLLAQGTKTQSASNSDSEVSDSSVLVVALAPIDTLLPNIQHLSRLVAGGPAAGFVVSAVKMYTGGLDTKRPAGVHIDLDDEGNPSPVICLPLSDLDAFFAQISLFSGEPEDLGDGLYALQLGGRQTVVLRKVDQWLVAGQTEDAVLNFDTGVTENLKSLTKAYDLRVQVNPQNIPSGLIDFVSEQLQQGIEQNMAQAQEMSEEDEEMTRKNAEQMVTNLKDAIAGTEKFILGLAINRTEKKTNLDFGSKFVPGSKFSKQIEKYKNSKASLAAVPQDESFFTANSLQFILPEEYQQIEDSVKSSINAALKQIDEKTEDPAVAKKSKEFVKKLSDLILSSARQGSIESAFNVSVESNLNGIASFTVADGKEVDATITELAAELKNAKDVPMTLVPNAAKYAGANIHRLSIPLPPEADPVARQIFGSNVTIAIASTPKAVHIAVGKDCDAFVNSALDRVGKTPSSPGEPVKARFDLSKLLKFIQSVSPNPITEAMEETAAEGMDNITVDSKVSENQSVVRISIEDNVFKAINSATKAAQGGQGF